jgi:hypothetical protein
MKIELIPLFFIKGFYKLLQPLILLCVRLRLNPNGLTTLSLFYRFLAAHRFAGGSRTCAGILPGYGVS